MRRHHLFVVDVWGTLWKLDNWQESTDQSTWWKESNLVLFTPSGQGLMIGVMSGINSSPLHDIMIIIVMLIFFFCVPSYITGVHFWWDFCVCDRFESNHRGNHIPSLWMVRAGCVFVAASHPSRTWMSGSFESVWWNACVHRLNLSLYSHPKEFWGMESEPMLTPRKKSPVPEAQRRVELTMMHHTGQ